MKSIILLFILFFVFDCGSDPIVITGKVVDKTWIPIFRAEVRTRPATDIVSTDKDGNFYLTRRLAGQPPEIQPGQYTIIVKKEGYKTLEFGVFVEKGTKWTDRRYMENEDGLVDEVDPTVNTEDETIDGVATPIMGI